MGIWDNWDEVTDDLLDEQCRQRARMRALEERLRALRLKIPEWSEPRASGDGTAQGAFTGMMSDAEAYADRCQELETFLARAEADAKSGKSPATLVTGADLRAWRTRLGLSQRALAARLGLGAATVGRAEREGPRALAGKLLGALTAHRAELDAGAGPG